MKMELQDRSFDAYRLNLDRKRPIDLRYEECHHNDVVIHRCEKTRRDTIAKILRKYKWKTKTRKDEVIDVELASGVVMTTNPRSLLSLSEAQSRPLNPLPEDQVHPPRLRKPGY